MQTNDALPPPVTTRLARALLATAALLCAAHASAETVRYCVANSSDTHGLYTNDVYYSPQCEDPNNRKCISREHFFSFGDRKIDTSCTSTLTVDYDAGTAVLHGWVGGNKNTMEVDVDIRFEGLHPCAAGDSVKWPRKWGAYPLDAADGSFATTLFCATTIRDAEPDGVPDGDVDGGFGGFEEDMDQQVDPTGGTLQFGLGGNGLSRTVVGGYANFKVNVPGTDGVVSPKTWELGMNLSNPVPVEEPPPPPPTRFDIVLCPSDSEDTGAGQGEEVAGRKDCTICWYGDKLVDPETGETSCSDETFVSTFKNEPGMWGQITLDGRYDIPDPRMHCGAPGPEPVGAHTVAPGVTVTLDSVTAPARPGLTISGPALTGDVYVPGYLCGIPAATTGRPFIRLINADADFLNTAENPDFREVVNSVVIHDADGAPGSQNPAFGCSAAVPNASPLDPRDPVIAWLPRTDEIPLIGGGRAVRDVTSGCGSTRGGSSTRSYLVSNLVHASGLTTAEFRAIIGAEIDALKATLVAAGEAQPSSCVEVRQGIESQLFPYPSSGDSQYMDHVRGNFEDGNYANVIQKLEGLLEWLGVIDGTTDTLDQTAELYSAFDTCYWKDGTIHNLTDYPALEGLYPPAGSGYIPRNFRGDLQAQTEHILWNIRQHLLAAP